MAQNTIFEPGDSIWAIFRKILDNLNANTATPMTDDTRFQPGDNFHNLLRKILVRVNQLSGPPASDKTTQYAQGDSQWSIARKLLQIFNNTP
jgi:hypothetical protein